LIKDLKKIFMNKNFRNFIAIFFILRFGVMMGAPFMIVDLVNNIHANYSWISFLTVITAIAMVLMQKRWGKISDWFGHRVVVVLCSFGISLVALGWVFVYSPWHVIPINILAGLSWAGFELAFFNYLLEISPDNRRATYAAILWTIMGVAAVFAPLIGSFLINLTSYKAVFFLSFILRLIAALLFLKFLKEVVDFREKTSFKYVIREAFAMKMPEGIHHYFNAVNKRVRHRSKILIEETKAEKFFKEIVKKVKRP
jgi:MFS family permease